MPSLTAFHTLTVMCVAVPTVFLVVLSAAVWFCGASDDHSRAQQLKEFFFWSQRTFGSSQFRSENCEGNKKN
jgi:hypothetical protein